MMEQKQAAVVPKSERKKVTFRRTVSLRHPHVHEKDCAATWYSSEELKLIRKRDAKVARRLAKNTEEVCLRAHGLESPHAREQRKVRQRKAQLSVLLAQEELWAEQSQQQQQQRRESEQQQQVTHIQEREDRPVCESNGTSKNSSKQSSSSGYSQELFEAYQSQQVAQIYAEYARKSKLDAYNCGVFCATQVRQAVFEDTLNAKIEHLKKRIEDIELERFPPSTCSSFSSSASTTSSSSSFSLTKMVMKDPTSILNEGHTDAAGGTAPPSMIRPRRSSARFQVYRPQTIESVSHFHRDSK